MNALLLAELARALRSGRLWMSVLRNAIPLAGVWLLVLVLAAASVWIEAAPRHATRAFGMPRRTRKRLFRRTSA